jgi:hypothetical protein
MKKFLFVLALVAVYVLSVSNAQAVTTASPKAKITVVSDDNKTTKDDSKKADVKKEGECTMKSAGTTGCQGKAEGAACCQKAKEAGGCPMSKGSSAEKTPVPAQKK